jgi:hypothetical protein
MPRSEPIAVFPDAQTRTRASAPLHAQLDTPAPVHAKANCGSCGEAWFGDVAYCPYCGRPSAGAQVPIASDSPAKSDFDRFARADNEGAAARAGAHQPGMGRKRWAKPLAVATVLAVLALAVGELPVKTSDKPGPQGAVRGPVGDAARSGTFEMGAGGAVSAPAVPRAGLEPPSQPRAPAPPARNRSLCSAANEAAGLCNPQ